MGDCRWNNQWVLLVLCGIAAAYWLIQLNVHQPTLREQPETSTLEGITGTPASRTTGVGTYAVLEGVEMVYEAPAAPKGVLLLFHGCQHSSTDWWPHSSGCSTCTGLPEEVSITQQAVQQGYVAVAVSSQMREFPQCWDTVWPPQPSSDLFMVEKAVTALIQQQGWSDLPLYALGASSGGAFALLLALNMPLQGVCCQIMSIPNSMLGLHPVDDKQADRRYPPTVFAHMVRDRRTAQGVAENAEFLRKQGTAVLELPVHSQPLTPTFFSNRTSQISPDVSAAIHATFQQADMLDDRGFLKEDPRQTAGRWQSLLREHVPATREMNLQHDESAIHEELNLAWAGELFPPNTTLSRQPIEYV